MSKLTVEYENPLWKNQLWNSKINCGTLKSTVELGVSTVEYENPLWTNMNTKNCTVDNCGLVVHSSTVRPIIPLWNCGKTSHKSFYPCTFDLHVSNGVCTYPIRKLNIFPQ